jgi:solute:Na+ symporter, SSS family
LLSFSYYPSLTIVQLTTLDFTVIALFFALLFFIGLRYTSESGKDIDSFFVGGRSLPWYWAGLSMVATTFAADTPLAVNELVTQRGIAGNWLWWSFLAGGMLTTFFFARLWQRAGVLTEAELIETRYGGQAAVFLRGFKGAYLGLFINTIIIAWVNLAMLSLLQVFFGLDYATAFRAMLGLLAFTALYSSLSGFKGVVMTDALQFAVAMIGCIILAFIVVYSPQIGGMEALKAKVIAAKGEDFLSFFPSVTSAEAAESVGVGQTLTLGVGAFFAYIGVQWWASWYPGAEPGGGGYIAQRMMSTRSEKDAVWATLFFQIAHYCFRPWAWIVVALAATILYPIADKDDSMARLGYVYAMRDFLPTGLRGLLLAAFFAAYMSTISTQVNWGASLIVNDLYKRFLRPQTHKQSDDTKHYVLIARIATIILALLGGCCTYFMDSIKDAWEVLMQFGAGLGLVLILRWYWRRITAWSEISAMVAPIFSTIFCMIYEIKFPEAFLYTVLFTTVVWLLVTFLVKDPSPAHTEAFWQRVHTHLYDAQLKKSAQSYYLRAFVSWLAATLLAYSLLFFIGKIILLEPIEAIYAGATALISFFVLRWAMRETAPKI